MDESIIKEIKEEPAVKKTPEEILAERVGKVDKVETYSSTTEFLIMYPNDYSILVQAIKNSTKYAKVTIYVGLADVTKEFFKNKSFKKVKRNIIIGLIERLSKEESKYK